MHWWGCTGKEDLIQAYWKGGENLLFTWKKIALQNLLFSVKHHHESGIGIHTSPLSWSSLPALSPSHPLGCYRAPVWVFWADSKVPLDICFTYGVVKFHISLSIHLTFTLLSSRGEISYTEWNKSEREKQISYMNAYMKI